MPKKSAKTNPAAAILSRISSNGPDQLGRGDILLHGHIELSASRCSPTEYAKFALPGLLFCLEGKKEA